MFTAKRRIVAVTVLAIIAVAQVLPVSAGTNGQQIRLWEDPTVGQACFQGNNQDGQYTYVCASQTPNVGNWYYFGGYWWKGNVTIYTWTPGGTYNGAAPTCNVPISHGIDWWTCYVP